MQEGHGNSRGPFLQAWWWVAALQWTAEYRAVDVFPPFTVADPKEFSEVRAFWAAVLWRGGRSSTC